jgi:hypothetical protein
MRFRIFYTILVIAASQSVNAQDIYNRHNIFNTILDAKGRINPYSLSGNPAFLPYDSRDQLLSVESNWSSTDGGYKKFLEPGIERTYDLDFTGKKHLDKNQIFKGMFSLTRLERHDWNWLAVKNYNNGSPFLLGDSTSGRTRYNGIFMNAQYSAYLTERFLTGFSISYGVDEGLKEIAPRPTSNHRDMDITVGAAYNIIPEFAAGLSFRTFDFLEQINYREDEGALYDETIIFKIRGFDYPLRISKKVESRISYHNRYYFNSDFFYNSSDLTAVAYLGAGTEQIVIKEDLSNPRIEGYWNNDLVKAGVNFKYNLGYSWSAGLSYKMTRNEMWARHPLFNVLLMNNNIYVHEASAGFEHIFSTRLSAGVELGGEFTDNKMDDFYGNVSYGYKLSGYNAMVGVNYIWSDYLKTFIVIGGGNKKNSDLNISNEFPSSYFQNSRYIDLAYLNNDLFTTRIHLNAEIQTGFPGIINLYVTYINNSVTGDGAPEFSSAQRSFLNAAVEFKVKVF